MKRSFLCLMAVFMAAGGSFRARDAVRFQDYFVDKTMRIDYFHAGDAREESVTCDRIYDQGIWAGSRVHLLDPFSMGRYRITVCDAASGRMIFSRGFDSYFGEYKTGGAALKGIKRTYHETALVPFPRKKVVFGIEARDRANAYHSIFSCEIDPGDTSIIRETPAPGVRIIEILQNGDPHSKTDIAFVAEGYTEADEAKLRADLDRFTGLLFSQEPYRSRKNSFNCVAVFKPSPESGTDEPSHGVYRSTAVGTTFDSLGSERYLLTEDNKALRDIAACVPYDALVIMVNHARYGGGGIYNLFCTFTTDNQWSDYLFLHEFGHSFGGLADEYYTSDTAYNDFYPRGVEPPEPNITALLDPAKLKWKDLATPGIEIPTPWEKDAFDRMDLNYQKIRRELNEKIARMKREGAPADATARLTEESERLSRDNARQVDAVLRASRFWGMTGAFEGAGYASKGMYRPELDCLMFSKGAKPFCKVCREAVARMIAFFGE